MANVIVVGDGPGGLSAALFLAKKGVSVTVYGDDKTAMHFALLKNYLGLPEITGSDFQKIARDQAATFGAKLVPARVEAVERSGSSFRVQLEGGGSAEATYLILSEGKSPKIAQQLGLNFDATTGLAVDANGKTTLDGVYAVGRSVRPQRSQAIISAGDGAAAALDILARIEGKSVQDWDKPTQS